MPVRITCPSIKFIKHIDMESTYTFNYLMKSLEVYSSIKYGVLILFGEYSQALRQILVKIIYVRV